MGRSGYQKQGILSGRPSCLTLDAMETSPGPANPAILIAVLGIVFGLIGVFCIVTLEKYDIVL